MDRTVITIPSAIPMVALTGPQDVFLRMLEKAYSHLAITVRGNEFILRGEAVDVAQFQGLINRNGNWRYKSTPSRSFITKHSK